MAIIPPFEKLLPTLTFFFLTQLSHRPWKSFKDSWASKVWGVCCSVTSVFLGRHGGPGFLSNLILRLSGDRKSGSMCGGTEVNTVAKGEFGSKHSASSHSCDSGMETMVPGKQSAKWAC